MKKCMKWITGKAQYRYINGGKGVISIFLALLMIPFIVQADVLVEISRYHAAVSALEQIMDSAAMSALSNYDSYLMERFGLTAAGQKTDPAATYQIYFKNNLEGSKIAWDTNSVSVEGLYPLNDINVLENAITEMAKLSVPTEMASDLVVDAIKELFGDNDALKSFSKIANAVSGVSNAVGALADVVTVFENLKDETEKANKLTTAYTNQFNQFKAKTEELAASLKEIEQKQQALSSAEQEQAAANMEGNEINNQIQSVNQQISDLNQKLAAETITQEEYNAQAELPNSQLAELQQRQSTSGTRVTNANTAVSDANTELSAAQSQVTSKRTEVQNAAQEYAAAISELRDSLVLCKQYSEDVISKLGTAVSSCESAAASIKNVQINKDEQKSKQRQEELKKENENLQKQLDNATDISAAQDVQNQINWNNYLLENYRNDTTYSDIQTNADNMFTLAGEGTKSATEVMKEAMSGYNAGNVDTCITNLGTLYSTVSGFSADRVTAGFVCDSNVYYVTIMGFSTVGQIQNALATLNKGFTDSDSDDTIGFWALIKGLSSMMDGLFKINLFYDASLDAVIQENLIGNEKNGIDVLILSLVKVAKDLGEIQSINFNILQLSTKLKQLGILLEDIKEAWDCLTGYVGQMLTGIASCVAQLVNGAYDKVLIAEYLNQSCANRTTYTGKDLLTGYSFSKAGMGKTVHEADSIFMVGALTSLYHTIKEFKTGSSDMFVGAETEYLLMGSRSEVLNQTMAFFNIYLIRLILDLYHIMTDPEVQAIKSAADAASFGIGGFVVLILYIVLEPFIDTLVIVNGAEINVLKSWCYLTPTGIPALIGRLTSLKLNSSQKDEIMANYAAALHQNYYLEHTPLSGKAEGTVAAKDNDSFLKFKYSNYMFLFLLFQDNNLLLNRFKNVILLESKKQDSSFDIGKTYTYISTEVNGKYEPFLSAASLYTNLAFSRTKNQVRGY